MTNNPAIPQRKSIWLPGYDYTLAGAYFITLVTWQRECLFGEVTGNFQKEGTPEMRLNPYGEILSRVWQETALIRPNVILDEFVIMPNHLHGIIFLQDTVCKGDPPGRPVMAEQSAQTRRGSASPLPRIVAGSIGAIIGQIKSLATKQINELRQTPGAPVWHRNYYDRIIRNERELDTVRLYIQENPRRWAEDEENLTRT
jgi:putative transposase